MSRMSELIEEMAQLHAEEQTVRYETYMRMRNVLNEQQRQQLAQISPQQMRQHMMQNMSMMDMMRMMGNVQMMDDMQMQCPMVGGGMPMMKGWGMMSMMENCPMMQGGMQNMGSME